MEPEVRLPPLDKAKVVKEAQEQLRRQLIYSKGGDVIDCPECGLKEWYNKDDYLCFLCREKLDD